MATFFIIVFAVLFGFMIQSQILIRSRAKALEGKPLPALPGRLGALVAKDGRIQSYHVGGVPSDVIAQFA